MVRVRTQGVFTGGQTLHNQDVSVYLVQRQFEGCYSSRYSRCVKDATFKGSYD